MIRSISHLLQYLLLLSLLVAKVSFAESFDDSEIKHIEYPTWFVKTPFLDLEEALGTAVADDKKGLMVFFTTEGCSYCDHFIRTSLADEQLVSALQGNFVSVGLEIFSDSEMTSPNGEVVPVKVFAEQQGVGFSPTLLFFGADGKRLLRLVGYQSPERFGAILDFLEGGYHRNTSLADYIAERAAVETGSQDRVTLMNDPLFSSPPYALQRNQFPAERPLLVLFERAGCSECESFHEDVLALEEVRKLLQQFELVRLNAADGDTPLITPQGKKTNPAAWYRQTAFSRLPALVFFDENGRDVLKTDALVLRQRMMNSLYYMLERAYVKGWSYQRFARSKAIEKRLSDK